MEHYEKKKKKNTLKTNSTYIVHSECLLLTLEKAYMGLPHATEPLRLLFESCSEFCNLPRLHMSMKHLDTEQGNFNALQFP